MNWLSSFVLAVVGTQEQVHIGRAVTITYTVDKLTADKVFLLDLGLIVCVPNCAEAPSIEILRGTRIPIPLCNENATFALPGNYPQNLLRHWPVWIWISIPIFDASRYLNKEQ